MLDYLQAFWSFVSAPIFSFDVNSPVYAVIALSLIAAVVVRFVREVISFCFSL